MSLSAAEPLSATLLSMSSSAETTEGLREELGIDGAEGADTSKLEPHVSKEMESDPGPGRAASPTLTSRCPPRRHVAEIRRLLVGV